jgi:Xaa-Pro aminopeptidase
MKRGLITWHKDELPPEAFDARLAAARKVLAERGLPALVVYSDVWRSNQGRYFSNFMPYWNRALLLIPREEKPVLLCALSPRVYPWIKSVTILEEIKPSPNLTQRVFEMAAEKGWKKIGVLDEGGLPYDLYSQLHAGGVEVADVPSTAIRPEADAWELAMCARAEKLAREILAEEMAKGAGLNDHEFVGRLEQKYRRAGAEDLVILIANPGTPAPASGAVLRPDFGVAVALEYRGHWVSLAPDGTSHNCLSPAGAEFV